MLGSILYFAGIAAVITVVVLGFLFAFAWRRVVPTNVVHIVQSAKKTISYGKGKDAGNVYYKVPTFIPRFGVTVSQFPLSVFDLELRNYEAYDVGRLPFVVDIVAYFRICDSDTAAVRAESFTELKAQLLGVLQGAVRRVLAINELETIMEDRAKLGAQFTEEVNAQLEEWGVTTVKMIEFMDIRDTDGSRVINNVMAKEKSRIEKESRETVAENMRVAEMKEVEAKREVDISRVEAAREVGIREADKTQQVGIANEKANQEVQLEQKTTMERMMAVREVEETRQAEIAKSVAAVKATEDREVRLIRAETEKDETIRVAEGRKEETIRIAEGSLEATKKDAEGIKAVGESKAEAERLMLLAPVNAQITLAEEIGSNDNYQQYLINVRKIEADESVGKEMAAALSAADLKVIANGGNINEGLGSLNNLLSSQGGTAIASMIEGLKQTEAGEAIVAKIAGDEVKKAKAAKAKPNGAGKPATKPN